MDYAAVLPSRPVSTPNIASFTVVPKRIETTVFDALIGMGFKRSEIDARLLAVIADTNKLTGFRSIRSGTTLQLPTPEHVRGTPNFGRAVSADALMLAQGERTLWKFPKATVTNVTFEPVTIKMKTRTPAPGVMPPAPKNVSSLVCK